ncbi:MAG: hypothetical protein R3Y24_08125 [Eubacteriales bacterium]
MITTKMVVRNDGSVEELYISNTLIHMNKDKFVGPCFVLRVNGREENIKLSKVGDFFATKKYGLLFRLSYKKEQDLIRIETEIKNCAKSVFKPTVLGLRMGIDSYMEEYPEWNDKLFPTFLRCEKTHFNGYWMSPLGKMLTIASENPVAAWSLDYNEWEETSTAEEINPYLTGGHRIHSVVLHLLQKGPMPRRYPMIEELQPEEKISNVFTIRMTEKMSEIPIILSNDSDAIFIQMKNYTIQKGELCQGKVYGECEKLELVTPDKKIANIEIDYNGMFDLTKECCLIEGIYLLQAVSKSKKVSEATIYVRKNNSWYIQVARNAMIDCPPIYTHHMESFNGFYATMLAQSKTPDVEKDKVCSAMFESFFSEFYDFEKNCAREAPVERIQDTAAMSVLCKQYGVLSGKHIYDEYANKLIECLIKQQGDDGAFYCEREKGIGTHYTSVTYMAKYLMDFAILEAKNKNSTLANRYFDIAKKAIQNLETLKGNFETEGEQTFEDGMISCSMTQLAYYALHTSSKQEKESYIREAENLHKSHRCLSAYLSPDCRCNSATIRFWEAQYNLDLFHNLMSTPCGWTAWQLYGTWYLYLLTGKIHYLRETMNGLGACMQLVDIDTEEVRWGFMLDPFIQAEQYQSLNDQDNQGIIQKVELGEQYLSRVSKYHRTHPFPRAKFGIDNLVYEVFKCLGEVALENACVFINEEGIAEGFNCSVFKENEVITVMLFEEVKRVHCNFDKKYCVKVINSKNFPDDTMKNGWILAKEC